MLGPGSQRHEGGPIPNLDKFDVTS
ncbi:MAG: hypothetical protein QOI16_2219, partial [Pseudonocardiales bacterium]|nr:hypothetical protein [Pseudonocardiales bacterium]